MLSIENTSLINDTIGNSSTIEDKLVLLQNILVAHATGKSADGANEIYRALRNFFMMDNDFAKILPDFIRRCVDLNQFWNFIQPKYKHYCDRRDFLYEKFSKLVEYSQLTLRNQSEDLTAEVLHKLDSAHVTSMWDKALKRCIDDPDGAITAAKTLIENVCKCILDDFSISYNKRDDLPKLWARTSEQLNLLPKQHDEKSFKDILGNCQRVVNGISQIRNEMGDAHGHGRTGIKPKSRHARLVVNLAGASASFLVETMEDRLTKK